MFQIDDILSMESLKDLDEGKNPGPMAEIEFWDIRCNNILSIHEQLSNDITRNMISILKISNSSYYGMFRYMK